MPTPQPSRKLSAAAFLVWEEVMGAIQNAEELGGSKSPDDYASLMESIADECHKRSYIARKQQYDNVPDNRTEEERGRDNALALHIRSVVFPNGVPVSSFQLLAAIRVHRGITGSGLAEAKRWCEMHPVCYKA